MGIIFTIVILGVIVFLHELGHFATAKYFGMPVSEFAIGMGPKIFSVRKGETVYSIRVLPLGGFVNIEGMQPENFDLERFKKEKTDEIIEELRNEKGLSEKSDEIESEEFVNEVSKRLDENVEKELKKQENIQKNGFFAKSPFSRFVVLIAGVMMNFISALIALFVMLSITGVMPIKYTAPVVGEIQADSRAKEKLRVNDRILAVNGENVSNWVEMSEKVLKISQNYKDEDVSLKILRDNKEITENVKLTYNKEAKANLLGIQVLPQETNINERIKMSFVMFRDYFKLTLDGVRMLVTGKVAMKEMTGPVGLPKIVGQAYGQGGFFALLGIFILISINIGIMNLLPIPALDGGRLIFVIPEFFGIKVNKKIEEKIHMIGMIFLLVLMLVIVFFDVTKYF
ncbi:MULTISPECIES: RIP metalloprotease [unclassified Leptotrichia]|jgi:peptidase, M50A subfamily|uniref:M50 family metallopeptidase n=1 Tax=unclassified Leptotrichia TaxID=2633022 RepID=UPI0003AE3403|nr:MULTISPECIES: site-2 protease family protein [unclassified Leptotrichia]ERL27021.1 putative RIP metalloprotease RseP [Leptotrichia sp. oral taxon 225 str. F0581]WLD74261.1 site-2 protease family protein [Leptotrichia sp. HMT-225]